MSEEAKKEIDWTDDAQVAKAMLGMEIEPSPPEGEQAAPEDAAPVVAQAETVEQEADKAQPRDADGKFMPLDAHKRVLENERHKREETEARATALAAELETLRQQMTPKQSDADFEAAIEELPDAVANLMRAERAARLEIEAKLSASEAARQAAIQQAAQAERERQHQSLLSTVPIVQSAYEDPIKRAAIDAISDALIAKNGQPTDLQAHYKAVQNEYVTRFNAAAPRSNKTEPPVPPSLSSIPGAAPTPPGNLMQQIETMDAMSVAARFASMTDAQLEKALAGL